MLNFVIAMQVIEIMGILRNGVCGSARSNELMDPQFTDYFPSETEGAQSESESESEVWKIIPYCSGLVANFQNWLSILLLEAMRHMIRATMYVNALFTFPSMVVKKVNVCVSIVIEMLIIFCYYILHLKGFYSRY